MCCVRERRVGGGRQAACIQYYLHCAARNIMPSTLLMTCHFQTKQSHGNDILFFISESNEIHYSKPFAAFNYIKRKQIKCSDFVQKQRVCVQAARRV